MEKTIPPAILWKKTRSLSFLKHIQIEDLRNQYFHGYHLLHSSQLITVDKNFSKKWGKTVLLSSLKGRSLFRLSFDKDFNKLITYERIRINKRIRDLIYIPKQKMIIVYSKNENFQ